MKENRNADLLQWAEEPLENLLIPRRELVTPTATGENRYVGLEHLDSGLARIYRFGSDSMVRSSKARFYTGDLLYGKLRPYLDKGAIAEWPGVCSTDILVFEVNKAKADTLFMGFFIHQKEFVEYAVANTDGVNHPRTSWSSLSRYRQRIPTVREQVVIGRLLSKIQSALEIQDKSILALKELKSTTLRKIFQEGIHNETVKSTPIGEIPESWAIVSIGDIYEKMNYGTSVRCEKNGHGWPVLRIPNVISGSIDTTDLKFASLSSREVENCALADGDLLFVRTNGNREYTGRCAVYHGQLPNAAFASYLIRVRLPQERISSDYVQYYANSVGRRQITLRANPAADGKFNVDTGILKDLHVPIPPSRGQQDEILEILYAIDSALAVAIAKRKSQSTLFSEALSQLMVGKVNVQGVMEYFEKEGFHV